MRFCYTHDASNGASKHGNAVSVYNGNAVSVYSISHMRAKVKVAFTTKSKISYIIKRT